MVPLWTAQLLTGTKSFERSRVIGSRWLNEQGLHAARVRLAHSIAAMRRRHLAGLVTDKDRAAFERDGFVIRPNFLPDSEFAELLHQVKAYRGPLREISEGDTILRKIALDPQTLVALPALRRLLRLPEWRGLIRYIGSRDAEPVVWIQSILRHAHDGPPDPQTALHADTFHPTAKAWLFLTDVAADGGPFTYVPGSHRLTPERLAWERQMSLAGIARLRTRRGSFHIEPSGLRRSACPSAHLRGTGQHADRRRHLWLSCARRAPAAVRVEIWAYGRRSPFVPWPGFDFWSGAALARRLLGLAARRSSRTGRHHAAPLRRLHRLSAFDPA